MLGQRGNVQVNPWGRARVKEEVGKGRPGNVPRREEMSVVRRHSLRQKHREGLETPGCVLTRWGARGGIQALGCWWRCALLAWGPTQYKGPAGGAGSTVDSRAWRLSSQDGPGCKGGEGGARHAWGLWLRARGNSGHSRKRVWGKMECLFYTHPVGEGGGLA